MPSDTPTYPLARRTLLARASLALASAPLLRAAPATAQAPVLRVGGTGAALAAARIAAKAFARDRSGVAVAVEPSLGSSGGIKALLAGAIDMAFSGRPLKDEERTKGAVARPFARSPFVFATPTATGVVGMKLGDVLDVYAGTIRAWPDGESLRLVLRPRGDSDTQILRELTPEMAAAVDAAYARPGLIEAATDQENLDRLEAIPGAFGTALLGQIMAERRKLKALRLDGVSPTAEALASGAYPFGKTLLIVLGSTPSPLARAFADFLAGPPGHAALAGIGGFLPPAAAS